jgi:hypothetical protein
MQIPVITLHQPWAQWVMLDWKTIETRTHPKFKSLEGKLIGIHAGQRWDPTACQAAAPFLSQAQLDYTRRARSSGSWAEMAGLIIATAQVTDHRLLIPYDSKAALIECFTPRYGLVLTEICPTRIKAQGKQGIWYYDLKVN